ncbi:hypothetical protein MCEMAEM4_02465 [Burkholderiaceae bacterium]
MHQRPLPSQTTAKSLRLIKRKMALFSWATLLMVPVTTAQTVYRCGDQYSANPSCNGATVASVEDARNARQTQAQNTQTSRAQQEADALEKHRLKSEQLGKPHTATPLPFSRDALFSSTVDSSHLSSPTHDKHQKLSSPYFTAKDNTPKPLKPKAEKNGASPKAAP